MKFSISIVVIFMATFMFCSCAEKNSPESLPLEAQTDRDTIVVDKNETEATEQERVQDMEEPLESVVLTDEMYRNFNIFISNFTEAGMGNYDGQLTAQECFQFAYQHGWFNKCYLEKGDYHNGYNSRISKANVIKAVEQYYGVTVDVDMFPGLEKIENYQDGYYYVDETGGNMANGFALMDSVKRRGESYYLTFSVYGAGSYDPSEPRVYSYSQEQARLEFGNVLNKGSAAVEAKDINNRKTFHLIEFSMDAGN